MQVLLINSAFLCDSLRHFDVITESARTNAYLDSAMQFSKHFRAAGNFHRVSRSHPALLSIEEWKILESRVCFIIDNLVYLENLGVLTDAWEESDAKMSESLKGTLQIFQEIYRKDPVLPAMWLFDPVHLPIKRDFVRPIENPFHIKCVM